MHEALGLLIAHRLSQYASLTLNVSCNDYGLEILSNQPFDETWLTAELFAPTAPEEIAEMIHFHEASKGHFREIARIAGLVFTGFPGKQKSHRQVQMSTGLLYDVLQKFDPHNLLLEQAKKEVSEKYLQEDGLPALLNRLFHAPFVIKTLPRWSPFSLPLFIEWASQRLSTETLLERIQRIQKSWNVKG